MATGYDIPHSASMASRYDARRLSGSMSGPYDARSPNNPMHRRSPSPRGSRRGSDSYAPSRSAPVYHDDPSAYRHAPAHVYRPEPSSRGYYSPSSPPRYPEHPRPPHTEYWDRSSNWHSGYPARDFASLSPTGSARARSRDEMIANRLFEPSDTWKQGHSARDEGFERYHEHPPPRVMDPVAESYHHPYARQPQPPRHGYIPGGDRYRPPRPPYPNPRVEYEGPVREAKGHYKREISPVARPYRAGSISSGPHPSRPSSRSSIASTHVSDTQRKPEAPVTRAADPTKSTASEVSPNSSGVSSTASTPLRYPSVGLASLANTFKALHSTSPVSSPLASGVVTAQVDAQKEISEDPGAKVAPVKSLSPPPVTTVIDVATEEMDVVKPNEVTPIAPHVEIVLDKETKHESVGTVSAGPLTPPMPTKSPSPEVAHKPFTPSPFKSVLRPSNPTSQSELDYDDQTPRPPPQILLEVKRQLPCNLSQPQGHVQTNGTLTMTEALRNVVHTRLVCDQQTRGEIVNPVILANQATLATTYPQPRTAVASTPDDLIDQVHHNLDNTVDYGAVRFSLADHFESRQTMANDKIHRLGVEYLRLHKRWKAHCEMLDAHATVHENAPAKLRKTRRNGVRAGVVRSEQELLDIMESLNVDEATDASFLSRKNAATIPDMISAVNGSVDFLFDNNNHRVDDPHEYYAPHTGIDDWTEEEKRIFIDKFAMYPKQFGLIADHLPHKTAAQCVDYYYLHKKRMIDFRKVVSQLAPNKRKRRGGGKKKGNALLADIAQHDAEVGKDHLSTFVVPSRVAKGKRRGRAGAAGARTQSHRSTPVGTASVPSATPQPEPPLMGESISTLDVRRLQVQHTPAASPTPEPEGRAKRKRKTAGQSDPLTSDILPPPLPPVPASAPVSQNHAPVVLEIPSAEPTPIIVLPPQDDGPPAEQVQDSELDPKPARKAKRAKKQVKSAAIIIDDPPSPPQSENTLVSTSALSVPSASTAGKA